MIVVSNHRFKNMGFDQICPMKNISLGPGQYLLSILKVFLVTSLRVVFCLRLANTVQVILLQHKIQRYCGLVLFILTSLCMRSGKVLKFSSLIFKNLFSLQSVPWS